MIDAKTLDYDFKEEELEFEEPFKQPEIPLNLGEKFSLGLVALGLLAFVVQLLGAPIKGTWIGLFLAFILPPQAVATRGRMMRRCRRTNAWPR